MAYWLNRCVVRVYEADRAVVEMTFSGTRYRRRRSPPAEHAAVRGFQLTVRTVDADIDERGRV